MYTYVTQDINGNFFVSRRQFATEEEARDCAYSLAEYDFITTIDVMRVEDVVILNHVLN